MLAGLGIVSGIKWLPYLYHLICLIGINDLRDASDQTLLRLRLNANAEQQVYKIATAQSYSQQMQAGWHKRLCSSASAE